LASSSDINSENKEKLIWLMDWVKFVFITNLEFESLNEKDELRNFSQSLWKYNINRNSIVPLYIKKLNMFSVN